MNVRPIAATILVVALNTIGVGAHAQDQTGDASLAYDQGLEAYLSGDYETAVEAFLRAEKSGKTSGELLYNTGNAYFRLNNLGKAVLYYERARRLVPTDDLLIHSARIARRKTMNRFNQIPRPVWSKWWAALVARLGPGWMFFVGLCFYLTAILFLGFRIWTKSKNDWLRRGFVLCFLAAIPLVLAAFKASRDQSNDLTAVVLQTRVGLRDSPSPSGSVETTVFEGLVVEIVNQSEGWVEIRLPDGSMGWINANAIEEV